MITNETQFLIEFNARLTQTEKEAVAKYKLLLQIDPRVYKDQEMLRIATNHMLIAFVIGYRYAKETTHEKVKEGKKER